MRLYVALDVSDLKVAVDISNKIIKSKLKVGFKIGLELLTIRGGFDIARTAAAHGVPVLLDLKLHDIPRTVAAACKNALSIGAAGVTAHVIDADVLKACVDTGVNVYGVTVLTSVKGDQQKAVLDRAWMAQKLGCRGVVCSGQELGILSKLPGDFQRVVPGVRAKKGASEDQQRVVTSKMAREGGAHSIVVGRPIVKAFEPVAAARRFLTGEHMKESEL